MRPIKAALVLTALSLPSAIGEDAPAKKTAWSRPETVAAGVVGPVAGPDLRAVVAPDGRAFVCWSDGGIDGWRINFAERASDGWRTEIVARIELSSDPDPRILVDAEGSLVLAWGSWDLRGGGYAVRPRTAKSWSKVRPLHRKCEGEVALTLDDGVKGAWIRPVKKFSPHGDLIIHGGLTYPYDKIAVGDLTKDGWKELSVVERENRLECNEPRLAGHHLLYLRDDERDDHGAELVYVDLKLGAPEVVADWWELGVDAEGAIGLQGGEPVIAYLASGRSRKDAAHRYVRFNGGVAIRWRKGSRWTAPRTVMRRSLFGVQLAVSGNAVHMVGVESGTFRVYCTRVEAGKKNIVEHIATGGHCALTLDDGKPVLFWCERTAGIDVAHSRFRIRTMRALDPPP